MATKKPVGKGSSVKKKIIVEPRIHFVKYLNNNEVGIKDIFIPMLKTVFGSELHTAKSWKKKVEEELHRELK